MEEGKWDSQIKSLEKIEDTTLQDGIEVRLYEGYTFSVSVALISVAG